jgi:class 3 adenylate cyclase
MTVCPSCGQENAPGAKFCSECGVGLLEATRPREERKVVTVLFADLVGFTAQAEQLDPEDVRSVLAPYYARLRSELERFGGTVEKFIGDAVMALFGADRRQYRRGAHQSRGTPDGGRGDGRRRCR